MKHGKANALICQFYVAKTEQQTPKKNNFILGFDKHLD
jgi:hypothetical protein